MTFVRQWTNYYLREKAMATYSSALVWKTPWTEEAGRLQSIGSLRVGHDWATSLSLFTLMHWRRKWQPTQCSCLENPRDGGAWWAAVYGVAQSWTRLKWLSSSNYYLQTGQMAIEQRLSDQVLNQENLKYSFRTGLFPHNLLSFSQVFADLTCSVATSAEWFRKLP